MVLYPDAAGVRETFHAMADRLVGLGDAVLLPDVYYRSRRLRTIRPGHRSGLLRDLRQPGFSDPAERERMAALAGNPTYDSVADERHWTVLTDLYAANLQN